MSFTAVGPSSQAGAGGQPGPVTLAAVHVELRKPLPNPPVLQKHLRHGPQNILLYRRLAEDTKPEKLCVLK